MQVGREVRYRIHKISRASVAAMQITKLGHSCLHVVDADADLLIDPGVFSAGFESLTGLTAVLITHQHPDHLDVDRLGAVLAGNPDARLYADPETVQQLAAKGVSAVSTRAGDAFDVGTPVTVHGDKHAVIHRDIPIIDNSAYLIGGRLFHPGDALVVPEVPVEILALPAVAPWMALKEALDYHRAVAAQVAFPIHEATASPAGKGMYYSRYESMGPAGTRWTVLDSGEPQDF